MPFLGQDWRSPGLQWSKVGTSKWETTDSNFGVTVETIPRNHVKKIIEAFLRQMQTTKNRNSYTNLTSAPISKCSVRENMPWLQIGLQGTRECHGYTTLGEMIRRLDFTGGVSLSYRFPYILQVTYLLVKYEMSTLSATAQQHLFRMVEILLSQGEKPDRGRSARTEKSDPGFMPTWSTPLPKSDHDTSVSAKKPKNDFDDSEIDQMLLEYSEQQT